MANFLITQIQYDALTRYSSNFLLCWSLFPEMVSGCLIYCLLFWTKFRDCFYTKLNISFMHAAIHVTNMYYRYIYILPESLKVWQYKTVYILHYTNMHKQKFIQFIHCTSNTLNHEWYQSFSELSRVFHEQLIFDWFDWQNLWHVYTYDSSW